MPDDRVTVLALCEQSIIFLRPNVLYRFEVVEDCENCKEIAALF